MNIEQRLRDHLESSTAGLRAPDHLESVRREGSRRQVRTRMLAVVGTAAAVAIFVSVGTRLISVPSDNGPVATTPTTVAPSPTTTAVATAPGTGPVVPPAAAQGVITAGPGGITLLDATGEEIRTLASDELYEEISLAFPDQRGGLVFQHAVTPEPWPQGSLMHLPAGATEPRVLVSPPEGRVLIPVGPATSSDGEALFAYLEDAAGVDGTTVLVAFNVDTGASRPVATFDHPVKVSVGGDVIALVERGNFECPTVELLSIEGEPVAAALPECLPVAAGIAVAHDGSEMAILASDDLQILALPGGTTVSERSIPEAYMVTSGPGGWAVRTPSETWLITPSGEHSLPPVDYGWVLPFGHPFDLPAGAVTLGSGTGELPCQRRTPPPVSQDLPSEVAATHAALLEMAAACDYAGLSDRALADGTNVSFGSPADPAAFWVAEGRLGRDPIGTLVELLAGTGAEDPQGTWAWPAEFVETEGDFSGYRVGIAPDGRWQFFVAGD